MPHYTTYTNTPLYISDSGIDTTTVDDIDISEMGIRPCDRKIDLYVLQPDKLNASGQNNPLKGKLTNCHVTGCERPFSVQKVPHSNLILLVVDTLCPCGSKQLSINPQEITYDNNANGGCLHKPKDSLYRRRPPKCINYHPEVITINFALNYIKVIFIVLILGDRDPGLWIGVFERSQQHRRISSLYTVSVVRSVIVITFSYVICYM